MDNKLFREKSIDRINSPEAMKDYMQVATPGIWLMLLAIVILLVGGIVWSVLGTIESKVPAVIVMNDGKGVCYFKESDNYSITSGMQVEVDAYSYEIAGVASTPERLTSDNEFVAGMLGEDGSILVIPAEVNAGLPDGIYRASIITEEITPIKFLTN